MTTKRNGLFVIGAILLTIGAGITTFATFYVYFYGLPVIIFLIGAILTWLSGRTTRTKILWTLIPIAIFFAYQAMWRWMNTSEPETFLISSSYRGKVHIIYNEQCGEEREYEKKRRVYRIPENGLLFTKFNNEYGYIDHQYFFIDSLGRRTIIPKMDVRDFNEKWTIEKNSNEPSRDSLGVFHWGRTGGGTFEEKNYSFQEFYVATYRQLNDTFGFKNDRRFDSLEYELIRQCRKSGAK